MMIWNGPWMAAPRLVNPRYDMLAFSFAIIGVTPGADVMFT